MNLIKKISILGILVTVAIFGALYFFYGQKPADKIWERVNNLTANEIETKQKSSVTAPVEKIHIKAYLNLSSGCAGGGNEVKNLLDGLVQEYPRRISVEYINFGARDGHNQMVRDGLSCQGLVINGKQTYTIVDKNGATKKVTFSHPINTQYTADDLKALVKMLLEE